MNLTGVLHPVRTIAFRSWRAVTVRLPTQQLKSFGRGESQISQILVINLDRQPTRWQQVSRELARHRASDGRRLSSLTKRLVAIDARDGRAVAATADVDSIYQIGDQLHVQPDARLTRCFPDSEPIRMTRQEVAVARSHIEAWKTIAAGCNDYVLVLEDDAWFRPGAASAIDRGWREALDRSAADGGPQLTYLSYSDAGGSAVRADASERLFRPVRGLWFLSGYVLSRDGAATLLRAMPVVGPVDLWMNYRFAELNVFALASPAIAQRDDTPSDNLYSVLPYLARAGIVDAPDDPSPRDKPDIGPVLAWTRPSTTESLATALSMLGLRVRAFDVDEDPLNQEDLDEVLQTFDALVDPPILPATLSTVATDRRYRFILEADARPGGLERDPVRSATIPAGATWQGLCSALDVTPPVDAFPLGPPRDGRLFRDDRARQPGPAAAPQPPGMPMDDSPWVLPATANWRPTLHAASPPLPPRERPVDHARMTEESIWFRGRHETFPGNLASFARDQLHYTGKGVQLRAQQDPQGQRPFRSGALASEQHFTFGRFEAEIRAAPGPGLITGLFLHRAEPRQEIDIELVGAHPRRMLTNVFFNPGDDGTAMAFGYRGSPNWVDLDFDTTADFHLYAIDWQPDRVVWLIDNKIVHERVSWDPTPIPHLGMRLHANLWVPRSTELAGSVDAADLPATASLRNVSVRA